MSAVRPTYGNPSYRLVINRPDGRGYRVEGDLPSAQAVEHRANEIRGQIRATHGWTPRFQAFYRDPISGKSSEVTHLIRLF